MEKTLKQNDGLLGLTMLNSKYKNKPFNDVLVEMANSNLSMEIITRLRELWDKTKNIAGEVIHIGKIIVSKILEFVKENQNMAIGIAIGVAIGMLVNMIPIIGSLLSPLATFIGVTAGAINGMRMDRNKKSNMEALIESAKIFFKLLADIINSVRIYWGNKEIK